MTKGRSGRNAGTNKIGESQTTNAESPNMPAAQRAFPCIWTTWLTKLLTGESSCEFAAWFRAHHQGWELPPNDFNFAQWQLDHTALLNDTRRKFEDSGYDVRVEAQNTFRLQGRTATLAGQPDLIIPCSDQILIVDTKTGTERASHIAQVMMYMYALPRALEQYRGARIAGEIHYPNRVHRVPRGGLDDGFISRLITLIHRVAAPDPPPWTPSAAECRFCDITAADCPERVEAGPQHEDETTDDF